MSNSTPETPEHPFKAGDWADHKSGDLDPRQVFAAGWFGDDAWIDLAISDKTRTGPVLASNYTRMER